MSDVETVSVSILGKDYQVNCKADEVDSLVQSAAYLDKTMQDIKSSGSILGLDRIAVMAALNISNDFLAESKKNKSIVDQQQTRIQNLATKLDSALNRLNVETPSS